MAATAGHETLARFCSCSRRDRRPTPTRLEPPWRRSGVLQTAAVWNSGCLERGRMWQTGTKNKWAPPADQSTTPRLARQPLAGHEVANHIIWLACAQEDVSGEPGRHKTALHYRPLHGHSSGIARMRACAGRARSRERRARSTSRIPFMKLKENEWIQPAIAVVLEGCHEDGPVTRTQAPMLTGRSDRHKRASVQRRTDEEGDDAPPICGFLEVLAGLHRPVLCCLSQSRSDLSLRTKI
jgi:hypothetical protein